MNTYETLDDFITFLWDKYPTWEDANQMQFIASELMDRVALPVIHAELEEAHQELCLDL